MTYQDKADATWPRRILNCLPSPGQETDWTFGAAVMAGVADTALPLEVDRREDGWWPVGDQKQTGSCVGWAVADALLRYHFVKAGWIGESDRLSTRFTWMASKEFDEFVTAPTTFIEPEGTSLKAALDVSRRYGAVLERDLPFEGGQLFPGSAQEFYLRAARLKIASYANLGPSPTAWRRWLANNGPILARLDVDATWDNASAEPTLHVYRPETKHGGHAVALVGYTPHGFIVRNSWGVDWGDGGYVFATNAYAAAAFTEAYGISLAGGAGVVRPAADAESEPAAAWGDRGGRILALVLEAAQATQGRPFDHLTPVSEAFGDVESLTQFLCVIEDELAVPGRLASAELATLEHLRRGFFDELADWIHRRVAPSATPQQPVAQEVVSAMTQVAVARNPAATVVFIDGVQLPQRVTAVNLPAGEHTLRVRINGSAGDAGTGTVQRGGQAVASRTARIPAGMTQAYSSEETFNV